MSISKQAVSDTLETVTSKLVRFEEKLKFFKKMQKLAEKVKDMDIPDELKKEIDEIKIKICMKEYKDIYNYKSIELLLVLI